MRWALVAPHDGSAPFYAVRDGDRFVGVASPLGPCDGRGRAIAVVDAKVLAPVRPGKVVCIGRNYAAHARELGNEVPSEPTLFLKPPSSVIGPDDAIVRPVHMSSLVHHEGELAVVIGKTARHVDAAHALDVVCGYTCGNDVTARDLQRKDVQFTRGKGFDTFCPLGPELVSPDELGAIQDKALVVRVNDEERQRGSTRDMVFPVDALIAFISAVMTLEPGDVILTGTPEGVGPLVAGDRVTVEIEGIGVLANPVRDGAA